MAEHRVRRLAKFATVFVFAVVILALAVAQVYQRIKRRQAEKLLGEISSLELRHATFEDAQKLAQEWRRYAKTSPGCSAKRCEILITLADYRVYPSWLFNPPWLARQVLRAGVRPARIRAEVGVHGGIVWSKRFDVAVYVRNLRYPNPLPLTLMAHASTVSRVDWWYDPRMQLHPEYIIGRPGGCDGPCLDVYTNFTPYADPTDVKRLMQINLSCLTQWVPCQDEGDILPQPWEQYVREQALRNTLARRSCSAVAPEILGRDSPYVAVVKIESVNESPDSQSYRKVRARMVRPLKDAKAWTPGDDAEFTIDPNRLGSSGIQLRKGSEVILMFNTWPEVHVNACGVLPLNAENLQKVQTGIDHDLSSRQNDQR